jgi:signal transduction histidine kinase
MTVLDAHTFTRRFDIPPDASVVPQVRAAVLQTAAEWGLAPGGDTAYSLRVIVSELVTNAVRHAGVLSPVITVTVRLTAGTALYVGVHDDHPFRPRALLEPVDDDSGRGLLIVKELVAEAYGRSGVAPDSDLGGKTVWVELPIALC